MPTIDPKQIEEWGRAFQGAADASYFREVAIALLTEREEMLSELGAIHAHCIEFFGECPSCGAKGDDLQAFQDASDCPLAAFLAPGSVAAPESALIQAHREETAAALALIEALKTSRYQLIALLREVEWKGENDGGPACPVCFAYARYSALDGKPLGEHRPDCRIAALLKEA